MHLIILPSKKRYKTKTLTRNVSDKIMSLDITLINFDNNSDVTDVVYNIGRNLNHPPF